MIKMCKEFYYRVQEGDSIESIISRFNTSQDNIIRNDNSQEISIGEWVLIRVNDYLTHIVRPMDTLKKISIKYNIPIEKILTDNHLKTDKLYIGQRLKLHQ